MNIKELITKFNTLFILVLIALSNVAYSQAADKQEEISEIEQSEEIDAGDVDPKGAEFDDQDQDGKSETAEADDEEFSQDQELGEQSKDSESQKDEELKDTPVASQVDKDQNIDAEKEQKSSENEIPTAATPEASEAQSESQEKEKPTSAPTIIKHSKNLFAVYQSDVIDLSVEATGGNVSYRWIKDGKTLCRESQCEFPTSDWSIGSHNISLVVFNSMGSNLIKYRIKIVLPKPGRGKMKVSPQLIDAENINMEKLRDEDLFIYAPFGVGYHYGVKDMSLVTDIKRPLNFDGKIKTQVKSLIRFGRKNYDEYTLLPKTKVSLSSNKLGEKTVNVDSGSIRVRRFDQESKAVRISVSENLSFIADNGADFLLRKVKSKRGKETIRVFVLRGKASAIVGKQHSKPTSEDGQSEESNADSSRLDVMHQMIVGNEYTFYSSGKMMPVLRPRSKSLEALVFRSSTGIFSSMKQTKISEGESRQAFEKSSSLALDRKRAESFRSDGDFESAITILSNYGQDIVKDSKSLLELSRSLRAMYQFSLAKRYLDIALKNSPEDPEVHFEYGLLSLEKSDLSAASKYFNNAAEYNYNDLQSLYYYKGVVNYFNGSLVYAKNNFKSSDWLATNSVVYNSSQNFQKKISEESSLKMYGKGIAFSGSKLLPLGDGYEISTLEDSTSYYGYYGIGNLSYALYNDGNGVVDFKYDFERRGHLLVDQRVLDTVDQQYSVDMGFYFGEDASFGLMLTPILGNSYTGDQRTSDYLIGRMSFLLPAYYKLIISLDSGKYVDPLLDRDDIIGPERLDLVSATDRSRTSTEFGMSLSYEISSYMSMPFSLSSRTVKYSDSTVASDSNFSSTAFGLGLIWRTRDWWTNKFMVDSSTFTYESSDSRKDSETNIEIESEYWITPYLGSVFMINSKSNASSNDQHSYSRTEYGFGMSLKY